MKIVLPAQTVNIDTPIWYEKLKQVEAALNGGALGQGALAVNATTGFGFISTCAGPPTGVPVAKPGFVPFVYDTVNNKFWIYNGAWRGVVVT
jgi:hypothetical protein